MKRRLSAVLALAMVVTLFAAPASAARPFPSVIDLPNGWAPEGITAGNGTTVYVGSLANGAVLKADVRTGSIVTAGGAGRRAPPSASSSRPTPTDCGSPAARPARSGSTTRPPGRRSRSYTFSPAGFLNDLVVTDDAVYVTDSALRPARRHSARGRRRAARSVGDDDAPAER